MPPTLGQPLSGSPAVAKISQLSQLCLQCSAQCWFFGCPLLFPSGVNLIVVLVVELPSFWSA